MKYKKDYSTKTADEWFILKKWTAFLMTIPLDRPIVKECESVREVLAIRAVAATLSNDTDPERDRVFSVKTTPDNEKMICINATKK